MKKLIIVALLLFLGVFHYQTSSANDYMTYQDVYFEHPSVRFLDDYTEAMYDKYYSRIDKKKFWGWRVHMAYKTEKVYFTKETLYKIKNEGTTAITETFSFSREASVKKQYNVSGTLGLKGSGDAVGFKLGLEEKLTYSITAVTNNVFEEDFTIKVLVDPNTRLIVEICGEGKVSNGVAKYYRFWKGSKKGGWEVFLVTTEYYSIRKEIIDESKLETLE